MTSARVISEYRIPKITYTRSIKKMETIIFPKQNKIDTSTFFTDTNLVYNSGKGIVINFLFSLFQIKIFKTSK